MSVDFCACRAQKGVAKVKAELGPTLVTNYKVWPAFQILNFQFVPVKLQVLYAFTQAPLSLLSSFPPKRPAPPPLAPPPSPNFRLRHSPDIALPL